MSLLALSRHAPYSQAASKMGGLPIDAPAKVAELLSWYRAEKGKRDLHPVILATMFHHTFVAIHPFDDGNGRMGRLLMNLILMQHDYPPAVIRLEEKDTYIHALEKANAGEIDSLVLLVARSIINTAQVFLKAARGESIDDLTDFDKRLQLLGQTLDSIAGPKSNNRTQESQNFVVARFISPLLSYVRPRLSLIEPHFAQTELNISFFHDGKSKVIAREPLTEMLEKLQQQTAGVMLSKLYLFFHATGYRFQSSQEFLCNITAHFHDSHFAIELHLTGSRSAEVYRGSYMDLADRSEAEEVAIQVLERIVPTFQKIAALSMPTS